MFRKLLSLTVIACFFVSTLSPLPKAYADSPLNLPVPGTLINLSPAYQPVIIKGLTVHKDNPFLFDFIVDVGQDKMSGEPLKKEGEKLIKYFLASLAIPDNDLWVNLSPYERNKILPDALGRTDMGRDLLEQDYILKQITASLIDPEKQLGRTFWDKVYAKAQEKYGTTQIPVNTFNKVWIVADRAQVFEHNQTAFVVDSHLKVMLEEDYLSMEKHAMTPLDVKATQGSNVTRNIIREIILPQLEIEVNTGKNFANLRQIFNSIILSSWYKKNLKEALLNHVYSNKSKVNGVSVSGARQSREQIYQQYLKAYKKGVFNYIKEEINAANGQLVPRKYFSGGMQIAPPHVSVITDAARGDTAMRGQNWNGEIDFTTVASMSSQPNAAMETSDRRDKVILDRVIYGGIFAILIALAAEAPLIWDDFVSKRQVVHVDTILKNTDKNPNMEITLADKDLLEGIILNPSIDLNTRRPALKVLLKYYSNDPAARALLLSHLNPNDPVRQVLTNDGAMASVLSFSYKVQDKDTLYKISTRFGITQDQLARDNGLSPYADLRVKSALIVRTSAQEFDWVVQPGDRMLSISLRLRITVDALAQANHIPIDKPLVPGQILKIVRPDRAMVVNGQKIYQPGEIITVPVQTISGAKNVEASVIHHNGNNMTLLMPSNATWRFNSNKQRVPDDSSDSSSSLDRATIAENEALKGGIDLNTANGMQWKINGDKVEMNLDPAMLARIEHDGLNWLSPVVVKMTPVVSVWLLVGINPPVTSLH